ncbi:LamG domain-containing protein, partial [bacterium]|nr:LamG domain-containing protein [bacterium]MBP5591792.1 LamG domain-containing protein [bacterium]
MKKIIYLLFCFVCFSSVLSAKLLTHLEFENSLEDSVGDNNGTFYGSNSTTYQVGRNGKALLFNGTSDYLEFGKNFDPRYNGHYSISMWVLSQEQASSTNNNCYISRHTSSGGNAIRFGYFSNQLSFSVKNEVVYISAAGNEPTGGWVHYVISAREQDNGTTSVAIYKNGSQLWSGTLNDVAGTLNNGNNSWVLGANLDPANSEIDFFKGKMDDIRIYDWNITADEVREIYYKEAAAIHLRMDDSFNSSSAGYIPGNQAGGAFFKQGMENRSVYL